MDLEQIRAQYPQYDDLSDEELAQALHAAFYWDMEFADFAARIGLNAPVVQPPRSDLSPTMGGVRDAAVAMGSSLAVGSPRLPVEIRGRAMNELMELFNREPVATTMMAGAPAAAVAGAAAPASAGAIGAAGRRVAPLASQVLRNKIVQSFGAGGATASLLRMLLDR